MTKDYLTERAPLQALFLFAVPIIIGNLFQQFYNMADSAIVGRYISEQALAAVGASYALTNVFICIAMGGGIGASVVVSRYFGGGRYKQMQVAAFTALLLFLIVSIILGAFGVLFSRQIMTWLKTPGSVLDLAARYLRIYFLGLPFLFMYNVLSAMFNALGKSRIPLYFLIFSSVFNVALDVLLVTRFQMGVAGVAWATLIAQGVSAVMSFLVFLNVLKKLGCGQSRWFDAGEMTEMVRIAVPSILQQSTVSIGMMLVQSVINSFGAEALAGYSAAMRIEGICVVPMSGIGTALSAYAAQNIGAGKLRRVPEGYRSANMMVIAFALLICLVLETGHQQIIGFFLGSDGTAKALATGSSYLRYIGWFFCLIGFKMAVDGLLRGAGDMKMFTIANLANLGIRVSVAMLIAPQLGIAWVWIPVPIGWFANWLISFTQYRTGKWRTIYQGAKSGSTQ